MPFLEDDSPAPKKRGPNSKAAKKLKDDQKLIREIQANIKDAKRDLSTWRKEAQQAENFFHGHQWEDDDVRALQEQGKPQITFNRIKPVVLAIVGTEVQHRQKIVFLPRHPPQEDVAAASDLATDAVDWAISRARGEYERSQCFQDMIIRGVGAMSFSMDFETDPEGKLVMERINPDEMLWDTKCRKQNLEDAKWVARRRVMSASEVKEMFPNTDLAALAIDPDRPGESGVDNDDLPTQITNMSPDPYREGSQKITPGFPEVDKGSIVVTQYQYYDKETYYRVLEQELEPEEPIEDGLAPEDEMAEGPEAPLPPGPQGPPAGPGMGPPPVGGAPMPPQMPPPMGGMMAGAPPAGPGQPPGPPMGPMDGAPPMGPPGPPEPPPPPPPDKWLSLSASEFAKMVDDLAAEGKPAPPALKMRRRRYWEVYMTGGILLDKAEMWMEGFSYRFMTCLWDSKENYWYGLIRSMIDPQRGANKWFSQGVHHFNSGAKGALLVETGAVAEPKKLGNDWARPSPIIQLRDGALTEGRIKVEQPAPFPEAAATMIQYAIEALRDSTGVNLEMLGASEGDESGVTVQKRQTQGLTILASVFSAFTRYREDEAVTVLGILKEHLSDGRWIRLGGPYNSQYRQLLKEDFADDYDRIIDDEPRDPNMKRETWDQLQPLLPILLRNGDLPEGLIDYAPLPASVIASIKKSMREQRDAQAQQPPIMKKDENPDWIQSEIEKNKAEVELTLAKAKAVSAEAGMGVAKTAQDMMIAKKEAGLENEGKLAIEREKVNLKRQESADKLQQQREQAAQKMEQDQQKQAQEADRASRKQMLDEFAQIKKLNEPGTPSAQGRTDPTSGADGLRGPRGF